MKLIDKDKNCIDDENYKLFKKGCCADIYKRGNELLKIYDIDCKYHYYLSKKMFLILKTLKVSNVVELLNYYYLEDTPRFFPMDAYTMKYVGGKDVKLIESPMDYLVDVLKQLEQTLDELSTHKIIIHDSHKDNILFKENGVTLIDVDEFGVNKWQNYQSIYHRNKGAMISYINDTVRGELLDGGLLPLDRFIRTNSKKKTLTCEVLDSVVGKSIKESTFYENRY